MSKIQTRPKTRSDRAALSRRAAQIRRRGQLNHQPVSEIVVALTRELPELSLLHAWRLAYGWSRPEVVEAIAALYREQGLAPPGLSSARLCRWEHDGVRPELDYVDALVRVYAASPRQLGLARPGPHSHGGYGPGQPPPTQGAGMAGDTSTLRAVADSVALQRQLDGPTGEPEVRKQVQRALDLYSLHYGQWPPAVMASEVHRTRAMVVDMLEHERREHERRDLLRLAGWLSGLLGNLAFHLGDYPAAGLHLATATGLGQDTAAHQHHLTCWSLGARSMVAAFDHQPAEALEFATAAHNHTRTPLQRAQITAWCELRALAMLGRDQESCRAADRARSAMDHAEPVPGRFGFDLAELDQHLAEAALTVGHYRNALAHTDTARQRKLPGSDGWAAALAIAARAHAGEHSVGDATALAHEILDAVAPEYLRETTRQRLTLLDRALHRDPHPAAEARQLRERLATLPSLSP